MNLMKPNAVSTDLAAPVVDTQWKPLTLTQALAYFQFYLVEPEGHLALVHRSGSYVLFEDSGNLTVKAARNVRLDAQKYVFLGGELNEAEADRFNEAKTV